MGGWVGGWVGGAARGEECWAVHEMGLDYLDFFL